MTRALSADLRRRTIAAVASGMTRRAAAVRFGVSSSSVIRWVAEWQASGRDHALKQGGDRRSHRIEAWSTFLLAAIETKADISLVELAETLAAEHGVRFAPSTIWRCLDRHDMTNQKKTAHASEQTRPDVAQQREAWFDSQPDLDPTRLIFIDETAVSTKMARLRGRSQRGTRCRMSVPHGHWKTTTFIGGLRLSGMTAPMMLDGPMTGEWFAAYTRKVLVPTLSPGDVVILDNLPAHKGAVAREAVEAVGARLLFLPPYSPDFNPIENIFAKMKAWIRRVAPRTLDALQNTVCGAIDDISHRQAAACFTAAGYEPD
ncbi:IS630 family transposase [Acetobacter ascendens]|nr:IS630 family transposase [Acetobacter ascendens]